ncbi:MAG: hypothetical protein ACI4XS_15310 [Bacillus sp. (in: firmicutes)]
MLKYIWCWALKLDVEKKMGLPDEEEDSPSDSPFSCPGFIASYIDFSVTFLSKTTSKKVRIL